jgi:hypothetical protein
MKMPASLQMQSNPANNMMKSSMIINKTGLNLNTSANKKKASFNSHINQ